MKFTSLVLITLHYFQSGLKKPKNRVFCMQDIAMKEMAVDSLLLAV
jgi:hypothetical protein